MAGTDSAIQNAEEESKAAVQKVRPLNATQAKALTGLVENDYQMLRTEMKQFHDLKVEAEVNAMKTNASQKNIEELHEEARQMFAVFRETQSALYVKARSKGLKIQAPGLTSGTTVVTDEDLETKIKTYRQDQQREFDTLMLTVRRQELDAKRRVLIASITTDAEKILAAIPTAKDVLAQMYSSKDLKELATS